MEQSFWPKKSLGQHFLKDTGIACRIVKLLEIHEGENVLEIGPGQGALTKYIYDCNPSQVILIEKDCHWADYHSLTTQNNTSKIVTHQLDALQFSWETLCGSWKIISNLPYNIGSALIWDIVSRTQTMTQAVFMVQKEVADRLCACPGTKAYGALSVWVQSFSRVKWGFTVKPHSFYPPPKVDSAVVVLYPLDKEQQPKDSQLLAWIIKQCFQYRRKQMQSILQKIGFLNSCELLERIGISPTSRPETLPNKLFQQLSQEFLLQLIDFPQKT